MLRAISSATFQQEAVAKLISCPVCLGFIEKPKILPPCGHTFCLKCIQQLVVTNKIAPSTDKSTTFRCPECRAKNQLPQNGAGVEAACDRLPTNFMVRDIVRAIRHSNFHPRVSGGLLEQTVDSCHVLLLTPPIVCLHCGLDFCESCIYRHLEVIKIETVWLVSGFEQRLVRLKMSVDREMSLLINEALGLVDSSVILTDYESLIDVYERTLEKDRHLGMLEKVEVSNKNQLPCDFLKFLEAIRQSSATEVASFFERPSFPKAFRKMIVEYNFFLTKLTPLQEACLSGNIEVFNYLIENQKANLPQNAIHLASQSNNVDLVKLLLEQRPEWYTMADDAGCLPIVLASKAKALDVVRFYIEAYPSVYDSQSFLFEAISKSYNTGIITCLLDKHYDWVEKPYMEPGTFESIPPILYAAKRGNLNVLKLFLQEEFQSKIQPQACGVFGHSIHYAAHQGHLECVKYLTSRCPELVNKIGKTFTCTPLSLAAQSGHFDVVQFLVLEAGAQCFVVNDKGSINAHAFFEAVQSNNLEVARFLGDHWPEVYTQTYSGSNYTALHLAASLGHVNMLRFLLTEKRHEIDVEGRDVRGQTALHIAVQCGMSLEAIQLLLEQGANPLARVMKEGSTNERGNTIFELLQFGADDDLFQEEDLVSLTQIDLFLTELKQRLHYQSPTHDEASVESENNNNYSSERASESDELDYMQ